MVLHIISSLNPGGRERQLSYILNRTNDQAIIFNKSNSYYISEYSLENSIYCLTSKCPINRFFEVLRFIRKNKPSIIWSWGSYEATLSLILSFLTKIPHINGSIRHGIVLWNSRHIWRLVILHLSRHVVANSFAGLKANKLTRGSVLYNGLDDSFFKEIESEELNDAILLEKRIPVLISVANLVPYKDYFTILKALTLIKSEGYLFRYQVIGDGPNHALIENYVNQNDLTKEVSILGSREDIVHLLSKADIFIHSSRGEGCSNAILEAMAAGLPLIVTRTGGSPEIVREPFGFLYDFGNADQLFELLKKALLSLDEFKKIRSLIRKHAAQNYSLNRMINEYHSIVNRVVNR